MHNSTITRNLLVLTVITLLIFPFVSATGTNAAPTMTGSPTGNVTCWGTESGSPEWKVFDKSTSGGDKWNEIGVPNNEGWFACDLGVVHNITNVSLFTGDSASRIPVDYTISAGNDNSTFTILHTGSSAIGGGATTTWEDIDDIGTGISYRYIKFNFTSTVSSIQGDLAEFNFTVLNAPVPPPVLTVCNVNSGSCFGTIQEAINDASTDDQINIIDGAFYNENIVVNVSGLTITTNSTAGIPTINHSLFGTAAVVIAANTVTIQNLSITNQDGNVIEIGAFTDTIITKNNIQSNDSSDNGEARGIYINGAASNVEISDNVITTDGISCCNYAINDDAGVGGYQITGNFIDSNGRDDFNTGISLWSGSNVNITNNIIFTNATQFPAAVDLEAGSNFLIKDNNITSHADGHLSSRSDAYGIYFSFVNNAIAINNNVTSLTDEAAPNDFLTCPVYFDEGSGNGVINGTLTSSTGESFCGSSSATTSDFFMRGVSFDKTGYSNLTSASANRGSQVFVQNFLTINVTDGGGAPISGASVNISSAFPNQNIADSFVLITPASGLLVINITEFVANKTRDVFPYFTFNNYTLEAAASGVTSQTHSLNITSNTLFALQLSDTIDPTFSAVTNNGTGAINGDIVNWTSTLSDDVELSFCWFTHDDGGSFVNETVQSCMTPFVFDQSIILTGVFGQEICGFFSANDTSGNTAQTANSCFTIGQIPREELPLEGIGNLLAMAFLLFVVVGLVFGAKALGGGKK